MPCSPIPNNGAPESKLERGRTAQAGIDRPNQEHAARRKINMSNQPNGRADGRESGRNLATNFPLRENTMGRLCAAATPPRIRRRRREGEKVLREDFRAGSTDGGAENPGRADLVRKRAYLHGARI